MATISAKTDEKVYGIQKWGGLNEHPDGDTNLKMGEASKMVNFKITRDGNLKLRPGKQFLAGLDAQYNVVVNPNLTLIRDVLPTDEVFIYDEVSSSVTPGIITMVGGDGGYVSAGQLYAGNAAQLTRGVLNIPASAYSIEDGIITITGAGSKMTIEELSAALAELGEGENLYTIEDGTPYALDATSLEISEAGYHYGGYRLTAEADPASLAPVVALWSGVLGGKDVLLAACGAGVWSLYDSDNDVYQKSFLGEIATDKGVSFFQFNGIVYILNGYELYQYNGVNLTTVTGYIPLVAVSIGPELNGVPVDAGSLLEPVNRLTPKRRCWISPDGTGTIFDLPESGLKSIDSVTDLTTGSAVTSGWSGNTSTGKVTFSTAPAKAVNKYEIAYTVYSHSDSGHSDIPDYRKQVTGNHYAELYSGTTDTRIFIYGDGTNKTLYSGMDYDGLPRADYFPDQYEALVGDSNTPITAMIRHYSTLVCYKPNECWSLEHGIVELATSDLTPAIYCAPVNRDKGNEAMGQVRLVENSPVTASGRELYHWVNSSYYTSNLTRDERQAKRISDRIQKSIKEIDFKTCIMWDDNDNQEFYIVGDGMALVWNYAVDVWYRYENFDAKSMCNFHGDLLIGASDGKVWRLADEVTGDNGEPIKARWESGAMDFGAAHMRKYSAMLWVGLKPVAGSSINVTVVTDRKDTFSEKIISASKAKIAGQPFMARTKLKAKKFVFYRLIFNVSSQMPTVVVTNVEIRVRFTGNAK